VQGFSCRLALGFRWLVPQAEFGLAAKLEAGALFFSRMVPQEQLVIGGIVAARVRGAKQGRAGQRA
jgi:hypothetical protein